MPQIFLPASFTRGQPKWRCNFCSSKFHDQGEQARHVVKCFRRNEAELREQSLREKAPGLFGTHNVDTEFYDWHRKRGIEEL